MQASLHSAHYASQETLFKSLHSTHYATSHLPALYVIESHEPPGFTCNRYQDFLRSSCVLTSRVPSPMMASPRLRLHTEDDSQHSACDCRERILLEQVLTLQLARLVAPKSLPAPMNRPDALEMGTTDLHDQFPI
ncbi:hypothetical protein DPMN_071239 [Dreissena polymorpha]|uniref:Uncharacterized protein n=1 Tax=Dreissena polymorpha TaxID=45954 RepID=A0A9D3Z2K8_DREPO|nr:hypothetical protein DPMN_071239 [Dreissena polymorpha]